MAENLNTIISSLFGKPMVTSAKLPAVGDYIATSSSKSKNLLKIIGINAKTNTYSTIMGDIKIEGCYYVPEDHIEFLVAEKQAINRGWYIECF